MNDFLETLVGVFIKLGLQTFQFIGESLLDNFQNFYRVLITIIIAYLILTCILSGENFGKIIATSIGIALVGGIMTQGNFSQYKYDAFETIVNLPNNYITIFSKINFDGVPITDNQSTSKVMYNIIKKSLNDAFSNFKILQLGKSLYLVLITIVAVVPMFLIYLQYWFTYFLFIFELTILFIIGIPIILLAPFQTFRPIFIAWMKALFGATLPIFFITLIFFLIRIMVLPVSIDVAKSIDKKSSTNSVEILLIVAILGYTLTKQIPRFVSLLTGVQDNAGKILNFGDIGKQAMNAANGVRSGYGVAKAAAQSKAAKSIYKGGKELAKLAGKGIGAAGKQIGAGASFLHQKTKSILQANLEPQRRQKMLPAPIPQLPAPSTTSTPGGQGNATQSKLQK